VALLNLVLLGGDLAGMGLADAVRADGAFAHAVDRAQFGMAREVGGTNDGDADAGRTNLFQTDLHLLFVKWN